MRYTLKHLEYFVATAAAGSIKLAAEKINISAPSISSAIAHLEDEFQVQLFIRRHAQGLILTPAGKRIARESKLVLRQADALYSVAGELRNSVSGSLSIGCMVTLAPMIIPELSQAFTSTHSDVELTIVENTHEQLIEQLRQVNIDAAISYDLSIPDDISFEPLASLPPQVLLSSDSPLAKKKKVKLSDLDGLPMILLDLPYSREYFLSLFQHEAMMPEIYARSAHQEVVRAMVSNGFGFTISNARPRNLTTLDGRKLVAVDLVGEHKPMIIGLATLLQEHKPMLLETFEKHCRKMISKRGIPGMLKV
ncbi:LysR substrate-binding domain-containing protein [Granulosicoccus antarcticus]|uniref:HTH-type transcriptional regulator CysB n=1 Tax=Granulosicoccus antarcticus IMCC3135 TaxID=1192854 RepID=A0A2Z2NTT7_9GAMM|nr:LysR substrate-binding domain-containing protein [Granulosicoccus antarcticus]ASJ73915.1 HTH-type transcriptional regulator CysB [Granulosicoccus antarcticus IMCC3135]